METKMRSFFPPDERPTERGYFFFFPLFEAAGLLGFDFAASSLIGLQVRVIVGWNVGMVVGIIVSISVGASVGMQVGVGAIISPSSPSVSKFMAVFFHPGCEK